MISDYYVSKDTLILIPIDKNITKVFDIISVYNNICVQNPHPAEKRGIDDERFPRYF